MRKLAIFCMAFAAGVFLAVYFLTPKWMLTAASVLVILGAALFLPFARGVSTKFPVRSICFFMALGLVWSWTYNLLFYAPAKELDGRTETVTATVTDYSEFWRYGHKADARLTLQGRSLKIRIYYYGDEELVPGDEVRIKAEFSATDTVGNDETLTVISRGYMLYAFARRDLKVIGRHNSAVYFPKLVSRAMKEKLGELFPRDVSAFLKAMLIGDRTEIDSDLITSSAFSNGGVYHILAVSGLHVSFFTAMIYILLGRKKWTAAVIIPLTLFFMAVTGFSPSVTRAGIMQIMIVSAPLFNRESDSLTSLGVSLGLILVFNPYAVAHAGLQMSFLATLGIIAFTPKLTRKLISAAKITKKRERSPWRKIRDRVLYFFIITFSTSVGATVLTVPVTALYFGRVSLAAPLANILVLWVASFIFTFGLIVCAVGFIWMPLASVLAVPVTFAVRYVLWVVKIIGGSMLAAVYTRNRFIVFWLVYLYGTGIIFFSMKGKPGQLAIPGSAAVIALCVILLATALKTDHTALRITALDVGQGECIVMTAGTYTAVADCGSGGYYDAGNILADYLFSVGRSRIDAMVLTHYDSDHINGVDELMERVDIGVLLLPDPKLCENGMDEELIQRAEDKGIDIVYVTGDMRVNLGGAEMNIYAPVIRGEENDMCVTCLLSVEEHDIFIPGDLTAWAERTLLREKSLPDIEVLVAGHHGARDSTSTALLEALTPEAVIISVGENSYGHPSEEVLQRIESIGAQVYRTDIMGNVTVTFD